jgi:Tfp pilus assembly protein PilP
MRLAKSTRTLLPLALWAVLATCALAQEHPNVQPSAVRELVTNQTAGQSQAPPAPQTPAQPAGPATAKAPAKAPAKAKEATKKAAAANPAKPPVEKPAVEKPPVKRDPFDALLTKARAASAPPENLPPGKAGLIVETLRIDGIVRSSGGMIAIVSNSQQRVYFLREGDKLYDGSVEKIALDAITFHEIGKDAFGKPLEHTVTKRLYPSPGEQQ